MKFCVHCEHKINNYYSELSGPEHWICNRFTKSSEPDPVSGWHAHFPSQVKCRDERKTTGECGPDGKHWKMKSGGILR